MGKFRKRNNGTKSMRRTAYKVVNQVLAKRSEVKYTNIQMVDNVSNNDPGNIRQLGEVVLGVNDSQRIGNTINVLSYDLRLVAELSDPGYNRIRCCIVHTFKEVTTPADFFDSIVYNAMANKAINVPFNRSVVRRVLLDKVLSINQLTGTTTALQSAEIKSSVYRNFYISQKNKLTYNEPTGAPVLDNFPEQYYYLFFCSDSTSALGGHPVVRMNIKMRYTDM